MGEVAIASFFVQDLGLALAPKMCPDQSQAFKEVDNSEAFTVGRKRNGTRRFEVLQRMFVQSSKRTNIRRTDCVGPILSQI